MPWGQGEQKNPSKTHISRYVQPLLQMTPTVFTNANHSSTELPRVTATASSLQRWSYHCSETYLQGLQSLLLSVFGIWKPQFLTTRAITVLSPTSGSQVSPLDPILPRPHYCCSVHFPWAAGQSFDPSLLGPWNQSSALHPLVPNIQIYWAMTAVVLLLPPRARVGTLTHHPLNVLLLHLDHWDQLLPYPIIPGLVLLLHPSPN